MARSTGYNAGCGPEHLASKKDRVVELAENKSKAMPQFASLDELVEFFNTHDLGEYWDQMPEAHFEVDIKTKTHLFAIDDELATRVSEIARLRQIPSQMLVNSWLREKVLEQA